jgi:cell division protein ZapE
MMMDMFCHALPPERRQRMHFHRFMRRVHDGLGRFSGQANPLLKVADEIASQGMYFVSTSFSSPILAMP